MSSETKNKSLEVFMELVNESAEARQEILENIAELIQLNGYDALSGLLQDPDQLRYLLPGEVGFLKRFCAKQEAGPSRLH